MHGSWGGSPEKRPFGGTNGRLGIGENGPNEPILPAAGDAVDIAYDISGCGHNQSLTSFSTGQP